MIALAAFLQTVPECGRRIRSSQFKGNFPSVAAGYDDASLYPAGVDRIVLGPRS